MIPSSLQIYLAVGPADMRCSIDGLQKAVSEQLQQDVVAAGALFVFCNKKRDRLKILWHDKTGFCLLYKRLDGRRRILIPSSDPDNVSIELSAQSLTTLLDGASRQKPTERDIVKQARAKVAAMK